MATARSVPQRRALHLSPSHASNSNVLGADSYHRLVGRIFFCMDEAAHCEFIHNGKKAEVEGMACVPVRCGESHGIYNNSDRPFRFFNVIRNSLKLSTAALILDTAGSPQRHWYAGQLLPAWPALRLH
jgi:hypothetical protein